LSPVSTRANYGSERADDKTALQTAAHLDDFPAVEEFLQLLARAVRQFHTYPTTSPLCTDAVAACHRALAALDRRDRLVCRVTPTGVIVDETPVTGAMLVYELARRLHGAHVIAVDIDRGATPHHLTRLCSNLIRCSALAATKTTFADLLSEDGVDTIVAMMAHVPEILDVGAPSAPLCDLVAHEQQRRQTMLAAGGPVDYLYPPDKGWVRLDPGAHLDHVSLVDLAVLINDPIEIATMLLRLTDDDPIGVEERKTALERKFSDVSMLFTSLDPRLSRVMFAKLARAVLELEPERRKNLLRRNILPGLLDGRADGTVLRDFPDVDLVDSLCLLLELETAAPEVLTTALHQLDLPAERRDTVLPLLDRRLQGDNVSGDEGLPAEASKEREIDRLARRLIRVDATPGKDFSEFASFDLSIDDQASAAFAAARDAIAATGQTGTHLGFLANLVRLEPNAGLVDTFLRQVPALFAELEHNSQWQGLATWGSTFRQLAEGLQEPRPDTALAITRTLSEFWRPARVANLADLHDRGAETRQIANALVQGFRGAVVPGMVAVLDDPALQTQAPSVAAMMVEHADLLAPALALHLGEGTTSTTRCIVKALGRAGTGFETAIAEQLRADDEQTSREVLKALSRIGSVEAAALVAEQLRTGNAARRATAEEALWRFPAAQAGDQARQLLEQRDFVIRHPDIAARLLTRAAQSSTGGLADVLIRLEHFRYRFWNPGLVRVALKARELRGR
jgi:hypothetical protein